MNRDERQALRAAALAALNSTRAPTTEVPSNWELQTSNSCRRIGTGYGDGDVLCGTKHPRDGVPDLLATPGVLDYVVAAQPLAVLRLLDRTDALEDDALDAIRSLGAAILALVNRKPDAAAALDEARVVVERVLDGIRKPER